MNALSTYSGGCDGMALAAIAGVQAGLSWTPENVILFAGMILLGGAVYCGIFILLFSTGFWFPRRSSVAAPCGT